MWSGHLWLAIFGVMLLAGCASGGSSQVTYVNDPWDSRYYDDDWIYYYDEHDDDFLAGLTDEQKAALKQKWDSLSPEQKQQISDRWNGLSGDQRAQIRQTWGGLDATQRQRAVSSMGTRAHSGALGTSVPLQATSSRYDTGHGGDFDRIGTGSRTRSFGSDRLSSRRGSFSGRGRRH